MIKMSSKLKMVLATTLVALSMFGVGLPVSAAKCSDGTSLADCAKQGMGEINPNDEPGDLTGIIQLIINMVIFAVGIIAVVMVILGGIQYSTSQGDAAKVKKAKDTILYGIVGLVVAILAFAIVNFVLTGLTTG
jgi:heme/copper-type cytochrome/quinol oxidase subunit 2